MKLARPAARSPPLRPAFMVEQLLRRSAGPFFEQHETALALGAGDAGDGDLLQAHARPGAGNFLGDRLEDAALEPVLGKALGVIAAGPGFQVQRGPALRRELRARERVLQARVETIDVNVQLVLGPPSAGIDRHADIVPSERTRRDGGDPASLAPGKSPIIWRIIPQQARALDP